MCAAGHGFERSFHENTNVVIMTDGGNTRENCQLGSTIGVSNNGSSALRRGRNVQGPHIRIVIWETMIGAAVIVGLLFGARGYEIPTSNALGAIVFENGISDNADFNVIIQHRDSLPQRVNKLHPSYISLQLQLLFIYGLPGKPSLVAYDLKERLYWQWHPQQLKPSSLFDEKSVLLGGDFWQTLPVKKGASKIEVISSCISESVLWPSFKVFTLKHNMRLARPDISLEEASAHLKKCRINELVGDGKIGELADEDPENTSWVHIPPTFCLPPDEQGLSKLIDFIYD
nr:DNA helicase [Tanacetum cinerariifolium]